MVRGLVAIVVGLTVAGIVSLAYITVLDMPPQLVVVGLAAVLGGGAAAWSW